MTEQDLGLVTSYGYARAGGYPGTVDEYEEYLANLPRYATDAQTYAAAASESADNASTAASETVIVYENTVQLYNDTRSEASAAAQSEDNARDYAAEASGYMNTASQHATNAASSASSASASANTAHDSAADAVQAMNRSETIERSVISYAEDATEQAVLSQSWAVGGTGTRPGENTNNAKYWSDQAQAIVGLDVFVPATETTGGAQGLVPGPGAGQQNSVLFGDATFKKLNYVYEGTTTAWNALSSSDKAFYKVVILTDD